MTIKEVLYELFISGQINCGQYVQISESLGPKVNNMATKNVNHPEHYNWLKDKCGIEVIDITRHMDFCLGNAIKYILRAGHKEDSSMNIKEKEIEDLEKAIWYINDKINQLKNARN